MCGQSRLALDGERGVNDTPHRSHCSVALAGFKSPRHDYNLTIITCCSGTQMHETHAGVVYWQEFGTTTPLITQGLNCLYSVLVYTVTDGQMAKGGLQHC